MNLITSFEKKDEVQDVNTNQLKLEVHDTYKKDFEKITSFKSTDDSDVMNKAYLDKKPTKRNGHLSLLEKDCNEFKLQYNKQSIEEILIQKAVKVTIQILYDKGLFDSFPNVDNVLKDFLFVIRR